MPSDEMATMYGNPLSEFLMFLMDFVVFVARSIYFLMETLILTITPNRYRKMKVSVATSTYIFKCQKKHTFSSVENSMFDYKISHQLVIIKSVCLKFIL